MGWLLAETWPWMLLTALLAVVITILLTIRKLEIVKVRERASAPAPEPGPPAGGAAAVEASEALADAEPEQVEPDTERALVEPDDSGRPGYDIKGHDGTGLYHTTASPYYGPITAEEWFDNEDSARAAGFTRWDQRGSDEVGGPAAERQAEPVPPQPESASVRESDEEATASWISGPGSAVASEDGTAPEGFRIKGNADTMLFHTEESPYYGRTRAEVWFSSEEAAKTAGFLRWDED